MPPEPARKRTIAFVDGQNLYYAAKEAFGYSYPNYDPGKLARKVCEERGWDLVQTRFYTGIPDVRDNAFWNHFWTAKLAVLGTRGVYTYARPSATATSSLPFPADEPRRPWSVRRKASTSALPSTCAG